MNIHRLYCPENLDIEALKSFCKERGHNKNFYLKLLHIVSTIYYIGVSNKNYKDDDFISLNSKILGVYIDIHKVKQTREYLKELGIVETLEQEDGYGLKGRKSTGYRLTEQYRGKPMKNKHNEHYTGVKIQDFFDIKTSSPQEDYIFSNLEQITIQYEDATNFAEKQLASSIYQRNCNIVSIDAIEDKNWFFTSDRKTGRVFHNVSNINKELRQFIRYKGQSLVEIDIANAQPLFLATLYPADSHEKQFYLKFVENGIFYKLIENLTDLDSDSIKKQFLTYLFSTDKNISKWKLPVAQAFAEYFPELAGIISNEKKNSHKDLSNKLQSLEANLVIKTIVPICKQKNIPVITIHDSILTVKEFVDVVKVLIKEECFKLYNVTPKIKNK